MEAEAKPFIEHLELKKEDGFFPSHTPFEAYSGEHNQCHVTVITNGKDSVYGTGMDNIGTVPASLATFLALHKMTTEAPTKMHLLINAGVSNSFICVVFCFSYQAMN